MSDVPAELESSFWRGHVRLGACSTAISAAVGLAYAAASAGPHRPLIVGVGIGALASSPLIVTRPVLRVLTGPKREPWLFAWSMSLVAAVTAAATLDHGGRSPFVALFFTSLVFTTTGFGRRGATALGASALAGYVLACLVESPGIWTLVLNACGLVVAAATCALTAGRLRGSLDERERLTVQLREQANRDGLTGCFNHQALVDRLEQEIAIARTECRSLGLVTLDLDDFKRANDTHGHLAGDELLRDVGATLRSLVRETDVVGRVGGDEFAIVMPRADEGTVRALAARVQQELEAVGLPLGVGVSVGLASLIDGCDSRDLRNRADQALYVAKRAQLVPLQDSAKARMTRAADRV